MYVSGRAGRERKDKQQMEKDASVRIGDLIPANGARVIAKHQTGSYDDQNEYVVLCLVTRHEDSVMPYEYVTWSMQANAERYECVAGHYHFMDIARAAEEFAERAGLRVND
jgi:hypothetical protein